MQIYSARAYEALFDAPAGDRAPEDLRSGRVKWYRTATIKAGPIVEIESYPLWHTKAEASRAREVKKKTRAAQQIVNERNLIKRTIRRANASFTGRDLFITLTYAGEVPDEEQARKDIRNYIKRVRTWRRRHGLPEMQYIHVIEFDDGSGKRKRIHFHMLMTGMDRDAAEKLWEKGRANSKRLQPDERGLERVVRYMLKAKRSTRRCTCSRNITEPTVTVSDKRMSARKVERLALGLPEVARDVLERMYKGYEYLDCDVKLSEFVAGAYVYAKMRRRDREGPPWEM